jgi:phosphoglycolate phosphatase
MNLLFDLDGTLTDPVVGITTCIQHALRQLGRDPPERSELARYIGPPLRATFAELLATDDQSLVQQAMVWYRERFEAVGMFENEVYPDVPAGLESLVASGHRLFVATSKPRVFAERIVAHFDLSAHFVAVYGSELDGRNSNKVDLIQCVLEHEFLVPTDTWMIGDRAPDIHGGRANGVRTIGVLWGYGSHEELRAAHADHLVHDMSQIVDTMCRYQP